MSEENYGRKKRTNQPIQHSEFDRFSGFTNVTGRNFTFIAIAIEKGDNESMILSQGYKALRLEKSFKKFYGRYQDLIEKYRRSVNAMVSDSFPGQFLFNM